MPSIPLEDVILTREAPPRGCEPRISQHNPATEIDAESVAEDIFAPFKKWFD
jgi:hypothetical protein